jgi:hypothetical protein
MGAGAVLHPILVPRPLDPALHDALALQKDQEALARDLWGAVDAFEAELKSSSRSEQEASVDENADDRAGQG